MPNFTRIGVLCLLLLLSVVYAAKASHTIGGGMTYKYLGNNLYHITLTIDADYEQGQPAALSEDNPAYLGVYAGNGAVLNQYTDVYYSNSDVVPSVYANPCGGVSRLNRLLRRTFYKDIYLPPNSTGYVITYQRCCRTNGLENVGNSGSTGATYYCTIPAAPVQNNCAVFSNDVPQQACLNRPFYYDFSATDADGDSLSYGFCASLTGGSEMDIKPTPLPPPYDSINYLSPYSAQNPVSAAPHFQINESTGMITGAPDKKGNYLVTVCCYEWRNGVLINTSRREFQLTVTQCADDYGRFVNVDTTIVVGDVVHFHEEGAAISSWTPGTYLDDPTSNDPTGHFTDAGDFTYMVYATSDSNCHGIDTVRVHVIVSSTFHVPTAFTPNGDNINDVLKPIPYEQPIMKSFKIFNRWGNLLFTGYDVTVGWDGKYKGVKQDMGVYFWEIRYIDNKGKERVLGGSATLIR